MRRGRKFSFVHLHFFSQCIHAFRRICRRQRNLLYVSMHSRVESHQSEEIATIPCCVVWKRKTNNCAREIYWLVAIPSAISGSATYIVCGSSEVRSYGFTFQQPGFIYKLAASSPLKLTQPRLLLLFPRLKIRGPTQFPWRRHRVHLGTAPVHESGFQHQL
jgi:hypothetical protein